MYNRCISFISHHISVDWSNRRFLRKALACALVIITLGGITYNISSRVELNVQICKCHQKRPHQHVYYLKTHKTGSTTMYSILAEYCRSHDLLPLLPRTNHINQSPPFRHQQLLIGNNNQKYDMVFNHHIYTPMIIQNYMHNDTFRFTTLRSPFEHFVSAFKYYRFYRMNYLMKIPGENPMTELLKHPEKYDLKTYVSYTNNRQSMDLGFSLKQSFNDTTYINNFIKQTEQRFDLVLITEYFFESLVILKRRLNWSTQDILHFSKNARKGKKTEINETEDITLRQLHAKFSQPDILLYDFFSNRFKELMAKENGLDEEVAEFKDILQKVREYCENSDISKVDLNLPGKKWTDPIRLLPYKCKWLRMPEVPFTKFLQYRQKTVLTSQ